MALPMIATPTYTTVIPSTGKTVKYRPFLVKEEKALLIAQQSEDPVVMIDTLKNVVKSCLLEGCDSVDKLATFDLEYLFMQIRSKAAGENIELLLACDAPECDGNEKSRVKVNIDLNTIQVEKNPEHTCKIELYDNIGVMMKYPTADTIKKLDNVKEDELEKIFDIIAYSIDYVYDSEQIYYAKDQKHEELLQFVGNLNSEQFSKLQGFFETMPKLRKEIEFDCPVCGKHNNRLLEGIQSFF